VADDKKPAQEGTGAGSGTTFDSHILTFPRWLVSLPTTAACVVNLAAPMVAALLAGGVL